MPNVKAEMLKPKLVLAFVFGLATGMPPVMVTVTLGFWLRSEGVTLGTIGFLSWIGLVFSLKFLWAPIVDAVRLPWLSKRVGHRRSWMLLGQCGWGVGVLGMATTQPSTELILFGGWAAFTALASATQDIAVDAWRIESAGDSAQELMASAYVLGVRLGYFAGNVPILAASAAIGWPLAYACAALGALAGLAAICWAQEPTDVHQSAAPKSLTDLASLMRRPVRLFWIQHGKSSPLLVSLLAIYFVPDGLISAMVAPLYADLGLAAKQIATVRGAVGFPAMLIGVIAGGWVGMRSPSVVPLAVGVTLAAASNTGFALLVWAGGLPSVWVPVVAFEGFGAGFAATAMVAFASRLTHLHATAAQFAILSSLMTMLPAVLGGLSGVAVETLQAWTGSSTSGYITWFLLTPLAAIPPLLMLSRLRHHGALNRGLAGHTSHTTL